MPLVGLPVPEVSSWTASLRACSSDSTCRSGFLSRVARMPGPRSVMTESRARPFRWGMRRTWQWAPVSLMPCSAALFTISENISTTWGLMLAATLLSSDRFCSSWSVRTWASVIEWKAVGSSMYVVSSCMTVSCWHPSSR